MRDHEWDLIEVGDVLDYLPLPSKQAPSPTPLRYQVYQLEPGTGHVLAVRVIANKDDGTANFTTTEVVRLSKNSDRWTYVACKAKLVASGGFTVTRAGGAKEYEECPTPRANARKQSKR